jgi:hypothetical protein
MDDPHQWIDNNLKTPSIDSHQYEFSLHHRPRKPSGLANRHHTATTDAEIDID